MGVGMGGHTTAIRMKETSRKMQERTGENSMIKESSGWEEMWVKEETTLPDEGGERRSMT